MVRLENIADGKSWSSWSKTPYGNPENWRAGRYRLSEFNGEPMTIDWVLAQGNDVPKHVLHAKETAEDSSAPNLHPALRLLESQVAKTRNNPEADGRRTLMDLCLKLESQNRGTRVGLGALHYIMRAAETSASAVVIETGCSCAAVLRCIRYL